MPVLKILILIFFLITNLNSQNTNNIISPSDAKILFINLTLTNLSKKELQDICKKLNISDKGSRDEIILRIKSFLEIDKSEINTNREEKIDKKDVIIIETAEEGEYLKIEKPEQEILTAAGNVHLVYNKIRLKANQVKLNTVTKEMMCEGNVILFDGSKEITGERIFYNLDTGYGIIYKGSSKLGSLVYKGEKIKKAKNDLYVVERGKFTSCDSENPHYYIEAKKVWVYPNDKIILIDAYYVIAGVKTCWLPLFFRFEKGTGIITSWGKRKIEGWYFQNTYKFSVTKDDTSNLKFDHYQRRGEYLGLDYHYKKEELEVLSSAAGAYDKKLFGDSNINPQTGEIERSYRWKFSFKNRYTFNQDEKNKGFNTTIRANFFKMSDYSFIQDFEMYRSVQPGFHYYDLPILRNDLYNQDANVWFIDVSDNRKNSQLSIKSKWNFDWNRIEEKWLLKEVVLPEINYTLSGSLGEPPKVSSTNTNKSFKFYPDLRYSFKMNFVHNDTYDVSTGKYIKSLNSRDININLNRTFSFFNFFQYIPNLGIGDRAYWPYNVSEQEKYNYEKLSYTYGNFSEALQLGPSSFNIRASHNLSWRFQEPPKEDEYGKITSHNLALSHNSSFIKGLSFNASTSYNLRVKKNEKIKKIEKERFSDLDTQFAFSLIKNINISERYIYSIRYSRPLTSNLNFRYSLSGLYIPFIEKDWNFLFSTIWNHNFTNPRLSSLNLNFNLNFRIGKNWNFSISTFSVNEKLYLYSRSLAKKFNEEYRNFLVDLLNSIDIFEPSKLRKTYFKLRSASISVNHDLHCWQMSFGYSLQQRFLNFGSYTQYPYFEHSLWLKVNMKYESKIGIDERIETRPPEFGY